MHGCEQSPFHHLDVFEHTLQVLDAAADIAAHPDHYLPRHADALRVALDEPVGDELDARTALRLAVLFHDIEKPSTRTVSDRRPDRLHGPRPQGRRDDRADPQALAGGDVDDPLLRAARRRAPAAGLHGARPPARPPRRLPLPARHRSRTRRRASSSRSPTGSRPAASAPARRTSGPTPRRPTSCSGSVSELEAEDRAAAPSRRRDRRADRRRRGRGSASWSTRWPRSRRRAR